MNDIKIAFAGDVFPGGVWTYEGSISSEIIELLSKYDLRVANLESALCDLGTECNIKMGNPKLGNLVFSPEKSIEILKQLNINVVSLANNHVCDCGYEGLARTIELLDENGIAHFGAGRDESEAKKPAIVNIKGKTICFLGYFPPDWEAPYVPNGEIGGLNQFVVDQVINDILKYRTICDYVFVIPHWGKEYTLYPLLSNVIDLSRILAAKPTGILGSHSHLPQTSFIKDNMVVAMSLGNFVFPDRYIIAPRKTYYPSKEERSNPNIPVTYGFPLVDELTLIKMKDARRIGLVCGVSLSDGKVSIDKSYTLLDNNNNLIPYNISFVSRVKMRLIQPLIVHPMLYSIYSKISNIILRRIIRTKYRIGQFNG